jgi:2-hydroxy-6-oxonona-2,4-dienedioate hydrolase
MVSAVDGATAPVNTAVQRYRSAENELWSHYGLAPVERWIELRDPAVRIRVVESGSGNPVLFIPGTGGTGPYWAPLVRELPHQRSIMVDRPGWGLSSPVDFRADEYRSITTRILSGVLDALGLQRVDVLGASIGALWAFRLAQAEPSRVGRVAVLGGAPIRSLELPTFIKLLRSPIGALMVRIPMKPGMLRGQLKALGHGAALERGAMDEFIAWRLAFQRHTDSLRHERDMVKAITGRDGFRPGVTIGDDELIGLRHPTLMVFGTEDPTGSADMWREFMARLPQGELRLVSRAGHMPWWDSPTEVAGLVRDFLAAGPPDA